jgi:hypothetical protein
MRGHDTRLRVLVATFLGHPTTDSGGQRDVNLRIRHLATRLDHDPADVDIARGDRNAYPVLTLAPVPREN